MISAILTPSQGLDAGWAILACCVVVTVMIGRSERRRKRNAKRRPSASLTVLSSDRLWSTVGVRDIIEVDGERMRITARHGDTVQVELL